VISVPAAAFRAAAMALGAITLEEEELDESLSSRDEECSLEAERLADVDEEGSAHPASMSVDMRIGQTNLIFFFAIIDSCLCFRVIDKQ
jgi:hypothetical protein